VRTRDVLRRRMADSLAALSNILTVGPEDDLSARQARFEESVNQIELIAKPLVAKRLLAGANVPAVGDKHGADAIASVRRLAPSVRDLIAVMHADPGLTAQPDLARLRSAVTANVAAIRRAIAGRPGTPYQHLPPPRRPQADQQATAGHLPPPRQPREDQQATAGQRARAAAAMRAIDGTLAQLDEIYPSPTPAEAPEPSHG
jgi:hypothetical protein